MNLLKKLSLSVLLLSYSASNIECIPMWVLEVKEENESLKEENQRIKEENLKFKEEERQKLKEKEENQRIIAEKMKNSRKWQSALARSSIWAIDDFYLGNWKRGIARVAIAAASSLALCATVWKASAYISQDSKKAALLATCGSGFSFALLTIANIWTLSLKAQHQDKILEGI